MCATFYVKTSVKDLLDFFSLEELSEYQEIQEVLNSNQRVFPHKMAPVIVGDGAAARIKLMKYSLVPKWSKTAKPKFATYNARIETVIEKPTWKAPFKTQHCLVPLSEFYEAVYEGTHAGNMVTFKKSDNGLLVSAGIYETWTDKQTGEEIDSFAILTQKPNEFIETVGHDRMPIFLNDDCKKWLQPVKKSPEDAIAWLAENQYAGSFVAENDRPLKAK